jgi:predicted nucleic acid-binding protein
VLALVDTNLLVYRFDPRDARKQRVANRVLRQGLNHGTLRIPHQAIVEFVAATTRPIGAGAALLSAEDARREAEELMGQFEVLYPNDALLRLALRGAATYRLSWFDAHLWAYAEHYGLSEILSEDFQHDRMYGTVRVQNPFR